MNLCNCKAGVNTAHGLCRVQRAAHYFFGSSVEVTLDLLDLSDLPFSVWPLAFAVEKEDFGHSGGVSYASTEKANIVGELTRSFSGSEFTVFAELVTQI